MAVILSRTEDDGTVIYAVELTPDGKDGQSLTVRAGPVYLDGQADDPGIWIEYQSEHRNSPAEGPVLLSVESWRELVSAVERQVAENGGRRTLMGNGAVARELGVTRAAVSNWVARGVLPPELEPEWVEGHPLDVAVWRWSQLPAFRSWYEDRRNAKQKRKK